MDIKEQFHYDIGSDWIIGYEDYGREEFFVKSPNKALVCVKRFQGTGSSLWHITFVIIFAMQTI
jgi:hypothetical protein